MPGCGCGQRWEMPVTDDDRIHQMLTAAVQPLPPPPGAFEQIRRRARRRKAARAGLAAAGTAVVIAAAATAPQLVARLQANRSMADRAPAAAADRGRGPHPAAGQKAGGQSSPATARSATPLPAVGSALSATDSGGLVPWHFRPTSVTVTGTGTGGLVGAVIGQAGTRGHCATQYCTSLAGTSDWGASWYGVSAPLTGAPRGQAGVSQLRFGSLLDGWAFGPQLWATTDGGRDWQPQDTYGMRVTALETAAGRAFAVLARCRGTGTAYAADCTSFSLYSQAAGSAAWTAVPGPVQNLTAGGSRQAGAASLAIASAAGPDAPAGYLLAPSGTVLTGPLDGAAWTTTGQIPAACRVGGAQRSGEPAGVQLASGSTAALTASHGVATVSQLLLSCSSRGSGGAITKTIYVSANGRRWTQQGQATSTGQATSLAAASGGLAVLATTAGICYSADSGRSWASASIASAPAGGFSYVGMTTAADGVAVPADAGLGEIFVTTDGGRRWQPRPV